MSSSGSDRIVNNEELDRDEEDQRERLAELLGRLLAADWLKRTRERSRPPVSIGQQPPLQ